jgi:hypothetical protein
MNATREDETMKLQMRMMLSAWIAVAPIALADQAAVLGSLGEEEPIIEVPNEVMIGNLVAGGTGCPQGSVGVDLSAGYDSLVFQFDNFVAEVGPGISPAQQRKFCQINLDLNAPAGWQYGLRAVAVNGYAELDQGVSGLIQSEVYFSGASSTSAKSESELVGPLWSSYEVEHAWGDEEMVWSPCGASRALNVKTVIRLDNQRERSLRGLLTAEEKLVQTYAIEWRRCE